jgi:hypothetical protein
MLFCLTADYTPQALNAMRENPNTDRRAALEEAYRHVRPSYQRSWGDGDLRCA